MNQLFSQETFTKTLFYAKHALNILLEASNMKRIASRFTLFLMFCALFTSAISFTSISEVKGAEQVLFQDNFEDYETGTFPSSGGWELWYDGAGTEHQIIVDNSSFSPTKSLHLLGVSGWAAYSAKPIETDSPLIGFNVSVRVESLGDGERDVARVGFATCVPPVYVTTYAPILFMSTGTIRVTGTAGDLQTYVADRWYKVTVIMDRNAATYSLWIDDVLVGENLPVRTNKGEMAYNESPWEIEAFAVSQNYHNTKAFFDDVVVFSVFEADPKLELVPNEGIAATTLVGSGFAPNSQISVSWDGIPIPTVPSPLISDGYGDFTGIISVLNQTNGKYTVRATDEMGNKATAIFTVTLEAQSQKDDENNKTTPTTGLPASLELLGGGAKWAAEEGSSALFINWKDNWLAHHLTDGTTWNPWPLESRMDNSRLSISYALEQAGFNVEFAGDIPETLANYDLVVIEPYWAVEPQHAPLIRDYISDGGGVVVLSGVPCYFTVYCKDMWPYRANGSEFDGYRFGLGPIQEWFGARHYINIDGYPHLVFDNPFGTDLSFGDQLMRVERKDAASVATLSNNTQIVALWESGHVFSFTHEYGQGRLYYQASCEYLPENILESNELVVKSSPITEIVFKIDAESHLTPHSIRLPEGTYVIEMPETQDGYIWSHWLEDGNINRTRTVALNENTTLTAIFTPENDSLVISVMSPENTTYSITDVPLEYTVNRLSYSATYSLDEQENVTIIGNTTLTGLSEGPHSVIVYVEDASGNVSASEMVYFTVNTTISDTTAPIFSVMSPANTTYSSSEVPLIFAVNEPTDVIGYSIDEQANVTTLGNTTLTGLAEGMHSLIVYANDTSGNTGYTVTYFTVAAPSGIFILSPESITYNTADISLTVTKNETCYYVGYRLDGQQTVDAENITTLSGLADGVHQLTVYANYTDRVMGESATVWFTVDTTPPNITDVIQSPVNVNGTLEDGVRVNATVTDALSEVGWVALNYTDDNGTWVTTEMMKLEEDIWNGTIPAFPHGTNVTYTIIAEDIVGNTVTTEELYGQPNQYQVLPEFLSLIILPLSLIATSFAVVSKKKTSIQSSFNKILQKTTKAQKQKRF
jgi:hypothetical protein